MTASTYQPRRQLVVNEDLQRRIVRDVIGLPTIAFAINAIALGVLVGRVFAEIDLSGANLPSLVPCGVALFGLVIIGAFALLSQALRVSNKVAGPQFGMHRVVVERLDRRGEPPAEPTRVKIRRGDYLHGAAADINRLFERVEELESELARATAEASAVASQSVEQVVLPESATQRV